MIYFMGWPTSVVFRVESTEKNNKACLGLLRLLIHDPCILRFERGNGLWGGQFSPRRTLRILLINLLPTTFLVT